ncbi:unnamed protein product, partial [Candidula unifasciata]
FVSCPSTPGDLSRCFSNVVQLSGQNSSLQPGISSYHGFIIRFESDSTVNQGRWAAVTSFDCGLLSVLPPLVLSSSDVQFRSTVGFTCLEGFRLEGPQFTICGWKGRWVPSELPVCTLITCPKEYPPAGGNAKAEEISFGYMREFFCRPDFQLVGRKFSHCNISGQWTDKVPVCEAQKCPGLHDVLNGRLNMTGPVKVGKSVLITCDEGYLLAGHDVLTCLTDLQFDFPLPVCLGK